MTTLTLFKLCTSHCSSKEKAWYSAYCIFMLTYNNFKTLCYMKDGHFWKKEIEICYKEAATVLMNKNKIFNHFSKNAIVTNYIFSCHYNHLHASERGIFWMNDDPGTYYDATVAHRSYSVVNIAFKSVPEGILTLPPCRDHTLYHPSLRRFSRGERLEPIPACTERYASDRSPVYRRETHSPSHNSLHKGDSINHWANMLPWTTLWRKLNLCAASS